ncbi:MAG: PCRF domain-containing protein [Candidatus Aenigmarchaeota archaeon]|nr:PCRF domain-containing protein [Candidatus Aenigmarchaeota archaeon]
MTREVVCLPYAFSGPDVKSFFSNEVGNHRWQRVSPTERRGRVHTSSITVAILDRAEYKIVEIQPSEVRIETTRGTGAGGQHKNTTDSCVIITHLATGIKVVSDGRVQRQNKEEAMKEITRRVNDFYRTGVIQEEVDERREQIGNGCRGDKRRTYRVKDDVVIDHITDRRASLKEILKGKIELLK